MHQGCYWQTARWSERLKTEAAVADGHGRRRGSHQMGCLQWRAGYQRDSGWHGEIGGHCAEGNWGRQFIPVGSVLASLAMRLA